MEQVMTDVHLNPITHTDAFPSHARRSWIPRSPRPFSFAEETEKGNRVVEQRGSDRSAPQSCFVRRDDGCKVIL